MAVSDDIQGARIYGVIRCGLSAHLSPTVSELAREFGLKDTPACYKEINEQSARNLARFILHRDLAYNSEIMPEADAAELAERFLAQFAPGARFFTNGNFHEERQQLSESVWAGPSWNPVTEATFDTGILVIAPTCSGCLWVEDED